MTDSTKNISLPANQNNPSSESETLSMTDGSSGLFVTPASLAVNIAKCFVLNESVARHLAYRALCALYPEKPKCEIARELFLFNSALASSLAYCSQAKRLYNEYTVDLLTGTLLSIIMERKLFAHE